MEEKIIDDLNSRNESNIILLKSTQEAIEELLPKEQRIAVCTYALSKHNALMANNKLNQEPIDDNFANSEDIKKLEKIWNLKM